MAKIADIGMARTLNNKSCLSVLSGLGTFAWSAPEVLTGRRCTEKVDIYSFGVVLWEICTGLCMGWGGVGWGWGTVNLEGGLGCV